MITEKFINSGSNLTQIKTFTLPFKSIIKNLNNLPKIDELVIKLNLLVKHTYQFIKSYVLFCYLNGITYEITSEFIKVCISVLGLAKSGKKSF